MRIRTIKPEFWSSESNGKLSRDARLVFVGLINLADNEGRLQANHRFLASQILPYDEDGLLVVSGALEELEALGKVAAYEIDGCAYAEVTGFKGHQKTDARYPSKLPPPPPRKSPPIAAKRTRVPAKRTPVAAECTPLEQGTGNREVEQGSGSGTGGASAAGAAKTPRETDALCEDFLAATGKKYAWAGAKDGDAFAELRKNNPLEEIRDRWRKGLRETGWLHVATVAQLRQKWNDLGAAGAARRAGDGVGVGFGPITAVEIPF